jgi:hypothetical protein
MGIDGVHDGGITELHPVFSVAVHLIDQDVYTATGKTEHWEFFIRNQGDEGNCSAAIHTLEPEQVNTRDYYISLPWPNDYGQPSPEGVSVSVSATPWVSGAAYNGPQASPGTGTYLHFLAPPYSSGDEVPFFGLDGEATLQYTDATSARTSQQRAVPRNVPAKAGLSAREKSARASEKVEAEENYDAEDFPWLKMISDTKDPADKGPLAEIFCAEACRQDSRRTSTGDPRDIEGGDRRSS